MRFPAKYTSQFYMNLKMNKLMNAKRSANNNLAIELR